MDDRQWLAAKFEEQRTHLTWVAYRMLGSVDEAEDAVQDAWLRIARVGADDVENLGGWLTTIVARVSLNKLRTRQRRREDFFDPRLPDPIISLDPELDPEQEAVLADSVGLALQVVLESLSPAERLAFVLHDMFELPFDEIARMVGRSPAATRQLASRARRRVKGAAPAPDADPSHQSEVVDAFFKATRGGDFNALVSVLDPDVVLRADYGDWLPKRSGVFRGVEAVAGQARDIPGAEIRPAIVNGAAGVLVLANGRPFAIMAFTVVEGRIVEIDAIADPTRVERIFAANRGSAIGRPNR
jgi:RNA polymerase sigma-70 factor, ECF subfamily